MHHLRKHLLKWGSSISPKTPYLRFSETPLSSLYSYTTAPEKDQIFPKVSKFTRVTQKQRTTQSAQSALLEYLHGTRNYPFPDAEHISKNCPLYIKKLLNKVQVEEEEEVVSSLSKLFHYHPVNEFEPFFESIGLTTSQIDVLLPRDLIYLKDDALLLENYHVLVDYGVSRGSIGKFYKSAIQVFNYDSGVLHSKLRCYEDVGLSDSSVIKVVVSCPSFLIGTVNQDFVEVLELLKSAGVEVTSIQGCLSEKCLYDWSRVLHLLSFICKMGCSKEELGKLMTNRPGLVFDGSGRIGVHLIVLLLKYGYTWKEIFSLLLQFPQLRAETFVNNLSQCVAFLTEIEMDNQDIGKIVREHAIVLGSCSLKKCSSIISLLNVGKKRLRHIIKEDPFQLKNWVRGLRVEPMPKSEEDESVTQKTEFFLNLGFRENSKKLKEALKKCKGKGSDLQERFDCFLKAGLDRKDIIAIIKESPQVLNQKEDVLTQKIDFLVNGLCYPISSLVAFPNYINHTIENVKLRYAMYSWLRDGGKASPTLALSTILACSEKIFVASFVQRHPKGLEVWEGLKKKNSV